ncbi:MAG: gliding motility lipoprotein GldH [Bacteroidales bacterium]|nr:gliding motility lipoprotein GldH [Bacteroidales bacterium]
MHKIKILIIAACTCMTLISCNKNVFYASEQDVDELGWNLNQYLKYDVDVEDTLQMYDFYIDLRNSTSYDKANTFLFIHTTFPDGSIAHDTLECPLADPQGSWYGRRTGRYIDSRFVFRRHVIFPRTGHYHFEIGHGMRDTNVVGLRSVGLRIEQFNK